MNNCPRCGEECHNTSNMRGLVLCDCGNIGSLDAAGWVDWNYPAGETPAMLGTPGTRTATGDLYRDA